MLSPDTSFPSCYHLGPTLTLSPGSLQDAGAPGTGACSHSEGYEPLKSKQHVNHTSGRQLFSCGRFCAVRLSRSTILTRVPWGVVRAHLLCPLRTRQPCQFKEVTAK